MRSWGAVVCVLATLWSPLIALDKQLVIYKKLDCEQQAASCQEFPAIVEEQLQILSKPITVYDREIEQIKIYSNGFIALGNHSTLVPKQYPAGTVETGQRLGSLGGDFIGVFTTVNHCSTGGRVSIREANIREMKDRSCTKSHIQRLVHATQLAYADDKEFDPTYILAITWSNMGCMTGENSKRNTFSLVLLSNGSTTYAVFQYINIEWTSDYSSNSLPPEAGIFIHGLETPQLPISDMPTAPQTWMEETNVAVQGEWVLALRQAALNADSSYQSKIRTNAEEFLARVGSVCNEGDRNYTVRGPENRGPRSPVENAVEDTQVRPTDPAAPREEVIICPPAPLLSDSDQLAALQCSRGNCNGSVTDCINIDGAECCVCPFGYYGGGSEPCRKLKSEHPFRIYLSGTMNVTFRDSPLNYHMPVFMDAAVRTSGEVLTQSGVHELPKADNNSSIALMSILSPLFHLLNSFVSTPPQNCEPASRSPTLNIFSLTGGLEKPFELTLRASAGQYGTLLVRGVLQRHSTGEEYTRGSLQLEVLADRSLQRLAEKCTERERGDQPGDQIYDVSYEKTEVSRVSFARQVTAFDCGEGNSLEVDWSAEGTSEQGCLLGTSTLWPMNKKLYVRLSEQGYCNVDCRSERGCSYYCLDLPSLYTTTPGACDCVKCERPGEICVVEGRSYACTCPDGYQRAENGGCIERANTSRDETSDLCDLPLETGPCKAAERRFGYSSKDKRCVEFVYGGCQGNANNFESLELCQARCGNGASADRCRNVRCGRNARCVDGRCICEDGYEGDAERECRRTESADRCRNVRCGTNARCVDGRCICEDGYEGDAERECRRTESADPCREVRCGQNARCEAGRCVCEQGYEGDAERGCQPVQSVASSGNLCELPLETGPCRAFIRRYGFNTQTGRCQLFTYGGCAGNTNNFETEEECMARCGGAGSVASSGNLCELPLETGPCQAFIRRYGFNTQTGRCQLFTYGGCAGNANNFETEEECMARCGGGVSDSCRDVRCGQNARCEAGKCVCEQGYEGNAERGCQPIQSVVSNSNPCELPFETGPCRAFVRRFGFNPRTGRCEAFTYGGCRGNENNFETEEECTARCRVTPLVSTASSLCDLPLDPGPCTAYVPRYGFNPQTKRCESFTYGGCEGNMNNFETEQECMTRCGMPKSESCTARCGPNAYCRDGVCICNGGYTGDPYTGCQRIDDVCRDVKCVANAHCEDGQCVCDAGYSGDGFVRCNYRGSCANVNCGTNAICKDGECICESGFKGDPRRYCDPIEDDKCGERPCGANAHCFRGRCECLEGYTGDPYRQCSRTEPEKCGSVICHEKARCHDGQCFCEYGYVGDGVTLCLRREDDLCKRVTCAENAVCDAGLCQCLPGYTGDGFSKCVEAPVDPELCGGKYCGTNAKCQDEQCVCLPGYVGDANDACVPEEPLPDSCASIQCGSNAYCKDGVCICFQGFTGDPYLACQPIYDSSCIGVSCGVNAYCIRGRCACPDNYTGDPNSYCFSTTLPLVDDMCTNLACHENATCSAGKCRCNNGFEGDGFIDCWRKDPVNVCDCGGAPTGMAGCSNGKCRCYPGFKARSQDGRCDECRGHSDCAGNARCEYDYDAQLYRCQCESGFLGDGAIACIPGAEANGTQRAGCRVPCHNFGSCDESSGRCRCRPGFTGNGYTYCDFDCSQCLQEATCAPELNKCICPLGYTGDGIKSCRVAQVQGRLSLRIEKDNDVLRMHEDSGPLELYCKLTGDVSNVAVRWLTPSDVGHQTQTIMSDGKQVRLTIAEPKVSHSGRYVCQAGGVADNIDVVIERRPMDKKTYFFLSSDNGILTVQSSDEPTAVASIWHIAENNRHKQVALALDCNADRLIYTSNSGHALRWGNASAVQLEAKPTLVLEDAFSKFAWIAVDPTSGNIFAVDTERKRIIVTHPDQPGRTYTFVQLDEDSNRDDIEIAGLAVHPRLSLVYWGQSTPGSSSKYSIQVARMSDGRTTELVTLDGSPITLNLATSPDMTASSTAGRICWFQRRNIAPYPRTEMRCAQLEPDGLSVRQGRLMKEFNPTEEPSNGLIQEDDAILWTPLYKRMYRSLNPSKMVFVKGVCCSNGFQSITAHKMCRNSYTNTCSFDNGRCRFFCMPGGLTSARSCKCPDDKPTCVPELS